MPDIHHKKNEGKEAICEENKAHQILILLVKVVIPDANHREKVVDDAKEQIEDEKQVKSLIFKANAVDNPWGMVVQMEHASVAN